MKMIRKTLLILALPLFLFSCTDLNVPPIDVVQDSDIFGSEAGIDSYMARLYSQLPIEDFRYTPLRGLNHFWIISPTSAVTGEALSRDQTSAITEGAPYWNDAYSLIRDVNYFLETLPEYEENFSEFEINSWLGEVYFVRAVTYKALAKRYGGVPIVESVLNYPEQSIEELRIPRSSEEDVWDLVAEDFDRSISLLLESNQTGRANRYAAAAFKSRAMLHAGTIAKYNDVSLFDDDNRLVGIPNDRAVDFFTQSYEAAKLLEGHYSLYMNEWAADDKEAQYQNFVNLFFSDNSPENIFVKEYSYPESVHGYDAYYIPRQLMGGNGYSSAICPTLDFVEMFDGLPKNENGQIDVFDENGNYRLFDNTMDFFADAEPRLRATVIFPGDEFKGENIEIRRGIYTNPDTEGGIPRILPEGSTIRYEDANEHIVSSTSATQTPYELYNGEVMNPAGLSGVFTSDNTNALSGFSIRKMLDPNLPQEYVLENRQDQTWIEMRYAEVLLNRAEAAYELHLSGQSEENYLQDAYEIINTIRERAGAVQLENSSQLNSIDIVRNERRKELAFENKIWWDLKRWRILHEEQNATYYRTLMPFYVEHEGKYFFDARLNENNYTYTFDTRWYYKEIPSNVISSSPNIVQNPGY
ncbi:MAG: RagB/SusD family nutrient uptake outer membrane protein [Balneolaceae bacterium]|nr:RagB/SusD family nutrient uptake outer membrane protein [Balneolaceae bacterium]